MRMTKALLGAITGLMVLVVWAWAARGNDQTSGREPSPPAQQTAQAPASKRGPDEASYWMRRKLELSQRVLEGLALGDFEQIAAAARTLDKLNTVESFVRGRNEAYRTQLEIFRAANLSLIRHADRQNLEGATLAFHQMTLSCVHCHQQLRETKSTTR